MRKNAKLHRPLQRGSFLVSLVVLAAIAFAVWHFGKDRIRQAFTVGAPTEQTLLEVTDFRCDLDPDPAGPGAMARGSVRNASSEGLPLFAQVVVSVPAWPRQNFRAIVTPTPLPPGKTGTFDLRTPLPGPGQDCRLAFFGVSGGGRDLGYRDVGRR